MRNRTLILIPALNPPETLVEYVESLLDNDFDVLIVDDGSGAEYKQIFKKLDAMNGCKVLSHAINMGKGRALKNAFNYFLTLPNLAIYNGIVTADSDGQHSVADVIKLAKELNKHPNSLILGCRNFDEKNVPPKSKFGNKVTRGVLKFLYGRQISDTQTGLRGFPVNIIKHMLTITGERFEYETRMLIKAFEENISIKEVEIETIYYNNNSETHFNPIKDSLKIYGIIIGSFIKYSLSSLTSFVVDVTMFGLLLTLFVFFGLPKGYTLILLSTILARIVSSLLNFWLNKTYIFKSKKNIKQLIIKYYILSVTIMLLSSTLVYLGWYLTGFKETNVKIVVDTFLFFLNYKVQRMWVFKKIYNRN